MQISLSLSTLFNVLQYLLLFHIFKAKYEPRFTPLSLSRTYNMV